MGMGDDLLLDDAGFPTPSTTLYDASPGDNHSGEMKHDIPICHRTGGPASGASTSGSSQNRGTGRHEGKEVWLDARPQVREDRKSTRWSIIKSCG
jgi:hypothetical protein